MSYIGLRIDPTRCESIPGSMDTISELPWLQRAVTRPFYIEDSQVVLQASYSVIMFPSAL